LSTDRWGRAEVLHHSAADGGFDLAAYPAVGAWLKRVASEPGHVPLEVAW
jgi:hypothetical protein